MSQITVDFSKVLGVIKPMHAVGQPPFIGMDFSMCDYLKAAHVPYSRLHDVGGAYGRNVFVDIPNLFRDFSKDPTDPENYDFAFTDVLISELVKRGIEPFFRLGVTIENYRAIKAYRIDPPADFEKWARICEGVIRHYNEGWANGFRYNITYWEIWNEPDNYETPEENQMWTGTPEEYYRLYETASKHLKKCFPHLKIGGYASCGFYALTQGDNRFAASTPRFEYFMDFFNGFIDYVKEHDCPLDFFSWHSYASIRENIVWANFVRETLDKNGFTSTEHTLNEWNCQPDLIGTAKHAALTCAMMLALQKTSLNSAMFYDARCGMGVYSGLFHCMTYKPHPAYYSLLAFGELYKRGTEVAVSGMPEGVYACAAKDADGCLVISNTTDEAVPLELVLTGTGNVQVCRIISENAVWEEFEFSGYVPENAVLCFEIGL